jgi:hypothetical protein
VTHQLNHNAILNRTSGSALGPGVITYVRDDRWVWGNVAWARCGDCDHLGLIDPHGSYQDDRYPIVIFTGHCGGCDPRRAQVVHEGPGTHMHLRDVWEIARLKIQ